jgi:hypothetical protein
MDRERGGRILQRTARQPMLILQNTPPLWPFVSHP